MRTNVMTNLDSLSYKYDNSNSKLYAFLATNYDISNLADKINAAKQAPMNILSLKERISNSNGSRDISGNRDIASA